MAATSYSVTTFAQLAEVIGYGEVILDTRQRAEHLAESIPRAINIPLHQLEHRLADIPDGEILVHCASGYRASIAASMLSRAGRSVTLVDDTFDNAIELGLTARPHFRLNAITSTTIGSTDVADVPSIPLVAPDDVDRLTAAGAVLIDVRDDDEWAAGRIDSALHTPLASFDPTGTPQAPTIVVCRSGRRAAKAAALLLGTFRTHETWTLDGGMLAWARSGRPVVADHGPGHVT